MCGMGTKPPPDAALLMGTYDMEANGFWEEVTPDDDRLFVRRTEKVRDSRS
jgi:hypothetical protein